MTETNGKPDLSAVKTENISNALGVLNMESANCLIRGMLVGTFATSAAYVALTAIASPVALPLMAVAGALALDSYSNFKSSQKLEKTINTLSKKNPQKTSAAKLTQG